MEEPGRDSSKYDTIMPTIVRPCTRDTFVEEVSNYPLCQLLYDPVPGTPL